MKKIRSIIIKGCILIALLGSLIYFHFIDFSILGKILTYPKTLALSITTIVLSYMTGTLRWWLILRSQTIRITYFHAFQIYAISSFSMIFVPGGMASSDAVRILMLVRLVPERRGQAVLAVFGDRFIAVLMLSFLAAILTLVQRPFRTIGPDDPMLWLNTCTLLLPVLLIATASAGWLVTRHPQLRAKRALPVRNAFIRIIAVTSDFFELTLENRSTIILAMISSMITTALLIGTIVIVSEVAKVPVLSSWEIAYAAALSLFANGLPISPFGIGVGEVAFNQICIWIAASSEHYPYATIFLAYNVISLAVSCYGAIALLNMRRLMTGAALPQPDSGTYFQ